MSTSLLPNCLIDTKNLVFDACDFEITNLLPEKESTEYSAYRFELDRLKVLFREAKTTPTKMGQFVTLWKRIEKGPIQPFDSSDEIDLFVINTRTDTHFGQFIFPKSVLVKQGVITANAKEGKRAIRVYPSWDKTVSKQAQKTQKWQLEYFLEIPLDGSINLNRGKLLYSSEDKEDL